MRNKLSAKAVATAKPREKSYRLGDGGGLNLIIRPKGNRSWEFRFKRPSTGKLTYAGLGTYPDISLAEARQLAKQYRKLVKDGIDPILYFEQKKHEKHLEHANTFFAVAELWIETKKGRLKERTIQGNWRKLELYAFPKIGKIPIGDLKAPYTIESLRPLEKAGKLESVKRTIQLINEVMNYATNYGLIEFNPLSGIGQVFKTPKVQHMPAIAADELQEFMSTLAHANMQLATKCLIEWQLHTMTRPAEAAGTRWDEINFEKELWIIPATRMKMGRQHIIPLTPSTLKIIEVMRPISFNRDYVFPSRNRPKLPIDAETANRAIGRMGFKGRTTAHGLRSLASTALNEQGFNADLIEIALAHIDKNQIRAAYNRAKYIERRREMMKWWSEYIERASIASLSVTGVKPR